jgi:hypothetical protein
LRLEIFQAQKNGKKWVSFNASFTPPFNFSGVSDFSALANFYM